MDYEIVDSPGRGVSIKFSFSNRGDAHASVWDGGHSINSTEGLQVGCKEYTYVHSITYIVGHVFFGNDCGCL